MACELSQFLLIEFSTLDCGSIHEYPRSHLHLLDSLTHSSFRRKFQITGTDLEPKILVNSRLFLGCPYYTAITSSPSPTPTPTPKTLSVISAQAVCEFKHTALLTPQKSATSRSNSFVFGPVVIQPERSASATCSTSASVISGGGNGILIVLCLSLNLIIYAQMN